MHRHIPRLVASAALLWLGCGGAPAVSDDTVVDANTDQAARQVVRELFEAYAKKDLEGYLSRWSKQAPDLQSRREIMREIFQATGPITVKGLKFFVVERTGGELRVEFLVDLAGDDLQTGKLYSNFGVLNRAVILAREADAWRIVKYFPPEADWAETLLSADATQRAKLLADRPELAAETVFWATWSKSQSQLEQDGPEAAKLAAEVSAEISARLKLPKLEAVSEATRGQFSARRGEIKAAEQHFARALELVGDELSERVIIGFTIVGAWKAAGERERALKELEELRTKFKGLADNRTLGDVMARAAELLEGHDPPGRIAALEESLRAYEAAGEKGPAAYRVAMLLGFSHLDSGDLAKALERWDQALAFAIHSRNAMQEALSRFGRGVSLRKLSRRKEAVEELERALALYDSQKAPSEMAAVLTELGLAQIGLFRSKQAIASLTRAQAIEEQSPKVRLETWIGLSLAHGLLRDDANAIAAAQRALELSRELKLAPKELGSLQLLGDAQSLRSANRQAARASYDAALKLARELKDRHVELEIHRSLGKLFVAEYDIASARKSLDLAVQVATELKDARVTRAVTGDQANLEFNAGNYARAIEIVDQVLADAKDDPPGIGDKIVWLLIKLSCLTLQGKHTLAIPLAEEIAAMEALDENRYPAGLDILAQNHELNADYRKEEQALQKIFEWSKDHEERLDVMAMALLRLSRLRFRQHRLTDAEKVLAAAGRAAQRTSDQLLRAKFLRQRGSILAAQGQPEDSLRAFQASVAMVRELGLPDELIETFTIIGDAWAPMGDFQRALGAYAIALEEAQRVKSPELANVLHNMGQVFQNSGKTREAEGAFRATLKVFQSQRARKKEGVALNSLGALLAGQGNLREGLPLLEQALAIAQELGDRQLLHGVQQNLGDVSRLLGEFQQALKHYQAARRVAGEMGDPIMGAASAGKLALVRGDLGQNRRALAEFQELLDLAQKSPDYRELQLTLRFDRARVLSHMGQATQAREAFEELLVAARQLHKPATEGNLLQGLAIQDTHLGRYAEALRVLREARQVFSRIGDRGGEARAIRGTARVLSITGQTDESIRLYREALKMLRTGGLERDATFLLLELRATTMQVSDQARFQKEYVELAAEIAEAIKRLGAIGDRQGLAQVQGANATQAYVIAATARRTGIELEQPPEALLASALEDYQSALAYSRKAGGFDQASLLASIGAVKAELNQPDEALADFEEARRLSADDPQVQLYCWRGIGDIHFGRRQIEKAVDAYQRAIAALQQLRENTEEHSLQMSLVSGHVSPYHNVYLQLARALIELNREGEALAAVEQGRSRTLVELFDNRQSRITRQMTPDQREQETGLETQLVTLATQVQRARSDKSLAPAERQAVRVELESARQQYDTFRRELYLAHPQLRDQRAASEPPSLEILQRQIFAHAPDLCVASYSVGADETLLFLLTSGKTTAHLEVHRLPAGFVELNDAVGEVVLGLTSHAASGEVTTDTTALYQRLLAPIEKQLAGKSHIVIMPDHPLHRLPFHALQDGRGKYLIERMAVSYAPSITALSRMLAAGRDKRRGKESKSPLDMLAVGRPSLPPAVWKDLPFSQVEVEQIAEKFRARGRTSLHKLGPEADERFTKQEIGRARFVHLATHGKLNDNAPLYSFVALSTAEGEDGNLEARELLDIDLKAELVVLSACETALGEEVHGEGVLGLTWSLFVAGTPSSMASLWLVADSSTSVLMVEFYDQLLQAGKKGAPPIAKAQALRQAQLKLLRDNRFAHPHHWAPFVLIGDYE